MAKAPVFGEFEYVLKEERDLPVAEQTVWFMRVLRWHERQDIERLEYEGHKRIVDIFAVAACAFRHGFLGWRNFKGREDWRRRDVEPLTAEHLDALQGHAIELSNVIRETYSFDEVLKKNS